MFFENIFYSRVINFLMLFFFLLLYQTLIADFLTLSGARLDLGIFVLVYLALNYSATEAVIFGFLWGLLQDVFNPSLLGLGALIKTSLGFVLANFKSQLYTETTLARALIILAAVICSELIYHVVALNAKLESLAYILLRFSLPTAVYTSVVGSLFWWWRAKSSRMEAEVR